VVVVDAGSDLETGSQAALSQRYWPQPGVTVSLAEPLNDDQLAALSHANGVTGCHQIRSNINLELDSEDRVAAVVAHLVQSGHSIRSVVPHQPTLEDLYFAIRQRHRTVPVHSDEAHSNNPPSGDQRSKDPDATDQRWDQR